MNNFGDFQWKGINLSDFIYISSFLFLRWVTASCWSAHVSHQRALLLNHCLPVLDFVSHIGLQPPIIVSILSAVCHSPISSTIYTLLIVSFVTSVLRSLSLCILFSVFAGLFCGLLFAYFYAFALM